MQFAVIWWLTARTQSAVTLATIAFFLPGIAWGRLQGYGLTGTIVAFGAFFNVPLMAHIQGTIAPEMKGQVFSMLATAMTWATPLGLLLAGPVSEAVGVHRGFAGSGLLMAAAGAACLLATRRYETQARG